MSVTSSDGKVVIAINADSEDFKKALLETQRALDGMAGEENEAATGALAMTAALAAANAVVIKTGAAAVAAASQYEAAFAKTQTIMDTTEVSVVEMNSDILQLSASSGMAAADVSEAVYQAISGSVDTADAANFVSDANKLAISGFTSLSNATDVLTTILNAYGMSADKVAGISNVLIQTQNLGKTSVDELSNSIGRAIATGSAYDVNLQNISASYVELTRGGIGTAEATTYLSGLLNELGKAGSDSANILQEQTGQSFGQLMASGWSLGDVLQVLSDKVNGDSEAFMGLFGSQEAAKAANALMKAGVEDFNSVLSQMNTELEGATGTTEQAYSTMTNTAAFIDQKLTNSVNNLSIAFGSKLTPAVNVVKIGFTAITEGLTWLVNKSPVVTAVVGGVSAGIMALSVALAAYTLKAKLATSATWDMTKAMMSNGVLALVSVIGVAVGSIASFASAAADGEEKTNALTAASERQRIALGELESSYWQVAEAEGETSAKALELKAELEGERAAFEESKETQEEYLAARESILRQHEEQVTAARTTNAELEKEQESINNLVTRLKELTSTSSVSAAAQQEILAIVDLLNDRVPELSLAYDVQRDTLSMTADEILAYAEAQHQAALQQERIERLTEAIVRRDAEYAQWQADLANVDALKESNVALEAHCRQIAKNEYEYDRLMANAQEYIQTCVPLELEEAERRAAESGQMYSETLEEIARLSSEAAAGNEELAGTGDPLVDAFQQMKDELSDLSTAYEETSAKALESIQGQMDYWDKAPKVVTTSVSSINAAMESQMKYWQNYSANMQNLYDRNIDGLNEMIAQLDDGSAESAGILAGMAKASDDELRQMVENYQELQGVQKETSDVIGQVVIDFSGSLDDIQNRMNTFIEEMNVSDEAKSAAENTVAGYIDGVESSVPDAVSAAAAVRKAILNQFNGVTVRISASTNTGKMITGAAALIPGAFDTKGFATGTASATPGWAWVGENGPELVLFRGGERVLTAEESQRAINAVYPAAPAMRSIGATAPAIAGNRGIQLRATIAVPLSIDGREFAKATASYIGEEMEFEVM